SLPPRAAIAARWTASGKKVPAAGRRFRDAGRTRSEKWRRATPAMPNVASANALVSAGAVPRLPAGHKGRATRKKVPARSVPLRAPGPLADQGHEAHRPQVVLLQAGTGLL